MRRRRSSSVSPSTADQQWTDDATPAPGGSDSGALRHQVRRMFSGPVIAAIVAGAVSFLVVEIGNQSADGGQLLWATPGPYVARLAVLVGFATLAAWMICARSGTRRPWWHVAVWALALSVVMWSAAVALAIPIGHAILTVFTVVIVVAVLSVVLMFIPGGAYVVAGVWWVVSFVVGGLFTLLTVAVERLLGQPVRAPSPAPPPQPAPSPAGGAGPVVDAGEPQYRWGSGRSSARDAVGGQIWWAELPFEDSPLDAKDRPVLVVENTGAGLVVAKITSKDKVGRPEFIKVPEGTDGLGERTGYLSLKLTEISYEEVRRFGGEPGANFLIRYNRARQAYEDSQTP